MDIGIGALLFGAGLAGGIANAMAGGATLITFPAMLASGLPPIVANASNAVAVTPGHVVAALADRARLPRFDRALGLALAASFGGGALGAILLLATPERLFTLLVPALIGIATLVFALGRQGLGRRVFWPPRSWRACPQRRPRWHAVRRIAIRTAGADVGLWRLFR